MEVPTQTAIKLVPGRSGFVVTAPGGKIALKGAHGKYLVAEDDGRANANRNRVGHWESFEVIDVGGNSFAFKSWKSKFLVAENDGSLNANRANLGPWEKFHVVCQK